jgi:hypothetical protein
MGFMMLGVLHGIEKAENNPPADFLFNSLQTSATT